MKHRRRDSRSALCWSIPALAVWCLLACRVDDGGNPAYQDESCTAQSYRGFCLPARKPPEARMDAAAYVSDAGDAGDAGDQPASPSTEGEPCANENDEKLCYDGPNPTRAEGACISGVSKCVDGRWTECYGQVLPAPEKCNALDDDCDGNVDESVRDEDCVAADTGCAGRLECDNGHAVCVALTDPMPETCNARDDDCDGTVDEDSDRICIKDNAGCTEDDDGIHCKGACTSGMQTCRDGALEACDGQVKPRTKEHCDPGDVGIDDDCDGHVDEDCACSKGATRACHAAARTGAMCQPGRQSCEAGVWGECKGAGMPHAEKCPTDGVDNDCNSEVDDVPNLGNSCVSSELGLCHHGKLQCVKSELRCVTPSAEDESCNGIDDNCNGKTDEDFDLQTDRNHCGDCNTKCDADSECCSGMCVDLMSHDHCGSCDFVCPKGTDCCGAADCVALAGDHENCGTCGHACGATEACCKGSCSDFLSNPQTCGGCGGVCEPDTPMCVEGNCVSM